LLIDDLQHIPKTKVWEHLNKSLIKNRKDTPQSKISGPVINTGTLKLRLSMWILTSEFQTSVTV